MFSGEIGVFWNSTRRRCGSSFRSRMPSWPVLLAMSQTSATGSPLTVRSRRNSALSSFSAVSASASSARSPGPATTVRAATRKHMTNRIGLAPSRAMCGRV
jgi:hypothetical protein